jgi:hypothetical protein
MNISDSPDDISLRRFMVYPSRTHLIQEKDSCQDLFGNPILIKYWRDRTTVPFLISDTDGVIFLPVGLEIQILIPLFW